MEMRQKQTSWSYGRQHLVDEAPNKREILAAELLILCDNNTVSV